MMAPRNTRGRSLVDRVTRYLLLVAGIALLRIRREESHGSAGGSENMADEAGKDAKASGTGGGTGTGFGGTVGVVAAAVTLVGSILTILGISSGVITALLRNNTTGTFIALGITVIGILIGVVSTLLSDGTSQQTDQVRRGPSQTRRAKWRKARPTIVAMVSLVVFFLGLSLLANLAANSFKTTQRPAISATVSPLTDPAGFSTLEATVTASGMSTNERYLVEADLIDQPNATRFKEIFFAYAGPKSDGTFEYKFKVTFRVEADYPWIGVTANLQEEGTEAPSGFQKCGLPAGPQGGTTCSVSVVPVTTTTTTTKKP